MYGIPGMPLGNDSRNPIVVKRFSPVCLAEVGAIQKHFCPISDYRAPQVRLDYPILEPKMVCPICD